MIGPLPPRIPFFLSRSFGPSPRTVPKLASTLSLSTVPKHASAPKPGLILAIFKMLVRVVPLRPIMAKAAVVPAASQSWMADFLFLSVRGDDLWCQYSVVVVVLEVAQLSAASPASALPWLSSLSGKGRN